MDYGKFDWRRLVGSVIVVRGPDERGARLGVEEGGFHTAEALVLARYFMFTQVYFHKTRVAFDYHLHHALREILPGGEFPKPDSNELDEFLKWDDWRVLGCLAEGKGGEHGRRLKLRDHYREAYHTPEMPTAHDIEKLDRVRAALGSLVVAEERAEKSWYKLGNTDIPIVSDNPDRPVAPLSQYSSVVANLKSIGKIMLYCRRDEVEKARIRAKQILEGPQ